MLNLADIAIKMLIEWLREIIRQIIPYFLSDIHIYHINLATSLGQHQQKPSA